MAYQGNAGISGAHAPPSFDDDTAPAAPDDHLARFIEALAHHSSVCRELHLDGQDDPSGTLREKSG